MIDVFEATVGSLGGSYADGTPKLEIKIPAARAGGQSFVGPEEMAVTLRIAGQDYLGHVLANKPGHAFVWFSPTVFGAGGERKTLGRVLTAAGFRANDRVRLSVSGRVVEVAPAVCEQGRSATKGDRMLTIAELWRSPDASVWAAALERYWQFVQPANLSLEQALDRLDLDRIRRLDARGWYDFLRDEYFRWKYTAPNRYATTTRSLAEHAADSSGLEVLDSIRIRLLAIDPADIRTGLSVAREIKGLGAAGASGLLALMYPATFATVDQFVVKALREVGSLPEADTLARMRPEALSTRDGVTLIGIMARKAAENNLQFGTDSWTPRRIDQVLWTFGR